RQPGESASIARRAGLWPRTRSPARSGGTSNLTISTVTLITVRTLDEQVNPASCHTSSSFCSTCIVLLRLEPSSERESPHRSDIQSTPACSSRSRAKLGDLGVAMTDLDSRVSDLELQLSRHRVADRQPVHSGRLLTERGTRPTPTARRLRRAA